MSSYVTVARPYAKAVFEHALEQNKLKQWSTVLHAWAMLLSDVDAVHFLENPDTSHQQQVDFLLEFVPSSVSNKAEHEIWGSFITLLSCNKRLLILPAVSQLFEDLRAEHEKTLSVDVISYSAFSEEQEKELTQRLKKRLKRDITLNISIDPNLLGGVIIQAGDLVIDGSVRGELNKLKANLVA